jgi:hypothetical protein
LWKGNIKLGGPCGAWLNREERKDLWGSNCFLLLDLWRWDLLLECLICSIALRLCTVPGNQGSAVSWLLAVDLIPEPPGCGAGLPVHRASSDSGEVRWGAEKQGLHPDGERRSGPIRQWPRTTCSAFFWMHELNGLCHSVWSIKSVIKFLLSNFWALGKNHSLPILWPITKLLYSSNVRDH